MLVSNPKPHTALDPTQLKGGAGAGAPYLLLPQGSELVFKGFQLLRV